MQLLLWKSPSSDQPAVMGVNRRRVLKITAQAQTPRGSPCQQPRLLLVELGLEGCTPNLDNDLRVVVEA